MALTPKQSDRLNATIREFGSVRYPAPYWFEDNDPDGEYCLECAKKKQKENPDWQRDGGNYYESDVVVFCATCGKPLAHTLTDYGKQLELEYFEAEGADLTDALTRYTLRNISGGYPLSHAERLYELIFRDQE